MPGELQRRSGFASRLSGDGRRSAGPGGGGAHVYDDDYYDDDYYDYGYAYGPSAYIYATRASGTGTMAGTAGRAGRGGNWAGRPVAVAGWAAPAGRRSAGE